MKEEIGPGRVQGEVEAAPNKRLLIDRQPRLIEPSQQLYHFQIETLILFREYDNSNEAGWKESCCSVSQSRLTLRDPRNCSRPGFPVLHHLLEFAQIHVHWVDDAIQPSLVPFSSCPPSFPVSGSFPMSPVFSNESALRIRWPKYWSFCISPSNEYSGLISFRIDWFDFLAVQETEESSPAPRFESISSLALSLLYGPTLTSIQDYWKNHSFDYLDLCQQSDVSKNNLKFRFSCKFS